MVKNICGFVLTSWNIWEDCIRLDVMEITCYSVDWVHLFQDMFHWCVFCKHVMNNDYCLVRCGAV
jgi:hypothetical protein